MVSVLPPVAYLKRAALDLLFPRWCIGCGREGEFLCSRCLQSLMSITPPVCPRCGRPQPVSADREGCPGCAGWQGDIDAVRAPFLFEGVIRDAVHQFKYNNLRSLAPQLAGLMYDYLVENPLPGDVLVPVPVHPHRLRERGYNQSALLARGLGRLSGIPVAEDCLRRTVYTPPQARSSGIDERQSNVSGAFACRSDSLEDSQVILIDDVSTSGSTLSACAGALKNAGAAAVRGLVLALEL